MAVSFCLKSRAVRRLLSVVMIVSLLPGSFAWGLLQPPLSTVTNPVFGTPGGTVPTAVPANLAPYVKDVPAAIRLGKALFWDLQAGSDGVTACASCHYRAGADPVTAPVFDQITSHKRNKNQLHPGPDSIFGNNSTVIRTLNPLPVVIDPVTLEAVTAVDPATGLPFASVPVFLNISGSKQFAPNYTLKPADFPLFNVLPATARLVIDPLTGLTTDAVTSLRDTNDVVGSQGIRMADFVAINTGNSADQGTPIADKLFFVGTTPNSDPANNIRQVTKRNAPSVINAVFNYTNFWDGRANNIFNGATSFGPLDQTAKIWVNVGTAVVPVLQQQSVAIPNSSLASQAVGQALSDIEMSFKGRTFPQLGKKMLSLRPLGKQLVHPKDSVFSVPVQLSRATLNVDGTVSGNPGLNTTYSDMITAAFQDNLTTTVPTVPNGTTQIEANFSLFWGLAIQLYEASLVSDRAPFDRFQAGNQNAMGPDLPNSPSAVRGFTNFDSKCIICHSGTEFSSAVVGSDSCLPTTPATECNRVAFTNNSTHNLIKKDVNIEVGAPPAGLIDTGFFNIGVRPTADDAGRGGNSPSGLPLSFSRMANQGGLPLLPSIIPANLPDKVQGSFKTPGLRNVELTAPYFHNGDALTLDQVVEFYTRGGNFPGNLELAAAMQPISNLRKDPARRADIVAFLKKLTDERVRHETAPFDHPELMIPIGVDAITGNDEMIILEATGGGPTVMPPANLTLNPVVTPTNLTALLLSGTVDDTATVAVGVSNTTTGVSLPTLAATVGGTVAGAVGGVAQLPTDWSVNLTGMTPGLNTITVTATSITGAIKTLPDEFIQITPTASINGAPLGGRTTANRAILTIGGSGVVSYQYSLDGSGFNGVDLPVAQKLELPVLADTVLPDGMHTVAVVGKDVGGNQQPIANATTATWFVKFNPPVLTLDATISPTGSSTQTISGTVEAGSFPSVSVNTGATVGPVKIIGVTGIDTWNCEIAGLAEGANNFTVTALDALFNETKVNGSITRILPDGNIVENGVTDISDVIKALRIAIDMDPPTASDMLHGDVAPLVDGKTTQNNRIDLADVLLILRKAVGFVTF